MAELAAVLSSNPFLLDLNKAKGILSFIGCLGFTILFGVWYFWRWDRWDHDAFVYVRREAEKKARKDELDRITKGIVESTYNFEFLKHIFDSRPSWVSAFYLASRGQRRDIYGNMQATRYEPVESEAFDKQIDNPLTSDEKETNDDTATHENTGPLPRKVATKDMPIFKSAFQDDTEEKAFVVDKESNINYTVEYVQVVIEDFMKTTLPSESTLDNSGAISRFIETVCMKHDYWSPFYGTSMANSRVMRWLTVVRGVLIGLFLDTLFFGIFYPADGTCNSLVMKPMCLIPFNKITSRPTCIWTGRCNPNPHFSFLTLSCRYFHFSKVLFSFPILIITPDIHILFPP